MEDHFRQHEKQKKYEKKNLLYYTLKVAKKIEKNNKRCSRFFNTIIFFFVCCLAHFQWFLIKLQAVRVNARWLSANGHSHHNSLCCALFWCFTLKIIIIKSHTNTNEKPEQQQKITVKLHFCNRLRILTVCCRRLHCRVLHGNFHVINKRKKKCFSFSIVSTFGREVRAQT